MADEKKADPKAKVTVRMLQSIAGVRISRAPGDTHECTAAEAQRLIDRGFAAAIEG